MIQIFITSMGAVFSKSKNVESFWGNILTGDCLKSEVSNKRLYYTDNYKAQKKDLEASTISDEIINDLRETYGIDSEQTRLETILHASCAEAVKNQELTGLKGGLILGMMNPDDGYNVSLGQILDRDFFGKLNNKFSLNPSYQKLKEYIESGHSNKNERFDRHSTHEITERVSKHYGFSETSIIVDAACASSLAAVDIAVLMMKECGWDYAVVGGAETNLSLGSFGVFDIVGALSKKSSKPFDTNTDGLMQGEGCGLLLLQKNIDNNSALAEIVGHGGSSDGRTSSLFQPDLNGQALAFERAHKQHSHVIDYIEAHGTGTKIGDSTEIESLVSFFKDLKVPLSSTKYQFGHTKGAAGAAGMIKAVKIINEKRLPEVSYITEPVSDEFILKIKETKLTNNLSTAAISAFGFGGSNFHSVVTKEILPTREKEKKHCEVYEIASYKIDCSNFNEAAYFENQDFYRIPPNSFSNIDKTQVVALAAVIEAFKSIARDLSLFPFKDTCVLSSSTLGLEVSMLMAKHIRSDLYLEFLLNCDKSSDQKVLVKEIMDYKNALPKLTEDFSTGLLNNVIAGRICHAFDIKGVNYNIEAGEHSNNILEKIGHNKVASGTAPIAILISVNEDLASKKIPIKRKSVEVKIICNKENYDKLILGNSEELVHLFPGQGSFDSNKAKHYLSTSSVYQSIIETAISYAKRKGIASPTSLENKETIKTNNIIGLNLLQFCQQVAISEELSKKIKKPTLVTAHSFGEFAALVSCGALTFEDAYHIVYLREKCSPAPYELGTLVVLSTSLESFNQLKFKREVYVANINAIDQIVIAIKADYIKSFLRELRSYKIPAKELKSVGRPYHSPLMEKSRNLLSKALKELDFEISPLEKTLLSTVNQKIYHVGHHFTKDELVRHISDLFTEKVNFITQMDVLSKRTEKTIIEVNTHSSLSSLVSKESSNKSYSASDYIVSKNAEESATEQISYKVKDHKIFDLVTTLIGQITGYKIEEIQLEQKLEEDLRIDSIKKAEILFRTFQERNLQIGTNLEVSKVKRVGDIVNLIENSSLKSNTVVKSDVKFHVTRNHWQAVPMPVISTVVGARQPITIEENIFYTFKQIQKHKFVIYVKDNHEDNVNLLSDYLNSIYKNVNQHLEKNSSVIVYGPYKSLTVATSSFLKSISLELNGFKIKSVFLESTNHINLLNEFDEFSIRNILYRNDKRYGLQQVKISSQNKSTFNHILSLGGSSGILKEFFHDHGLNAKISVVGRSPSTKEDIGVDSYYQIDAHHEESLNSVINEATLKYGKIDCIIDATGIQTSEEFVNMSTETIHKQIKSKNLALTYIKKYYQGKNDSPQILKFNSIAASHGNTGQSVYAFANDLYSVDQNISMVYLPPTNGVGMTSNEHILRTVQMLGIDLLPKDQIKDIVQTALSNIGDNLSVTTEDNEFLLNAQLNRDIIDIGSRTSSQLDFIMTLKLSPNHFLNDHIIVTKKIVPASLFLAKLFVAQKSYLQRMPSLEQYELNNLITLEAGPVEIQTVFEISENQDTVANISSHLNNFKITFKESNKTLPNIHYNKTTLKSNLVIDDFYSDKYLDFKGIFANLEWVKISDKNMAIAKLAPIAVLPEIDTEVLNTMMIFEAAFQTLGGLLMWQHKMTMVPTKLSGFIINYDLSQEHFYIIAKDLEEISDSRWVGSVDFVNKDGMLLAQVKQIECAPLMKYDEYPIGVEEISEVLWT